MSEQSDFDATTGEELPARVCASCGAGLAVGQHFCIRCGSPIATEPSEVVGAASSAPAAESAADEAPGHPKRGTSVRRKLAIGVVALVLVALAAGNVYLFSSLSSANDEIAALEDDKADLQRGLAYTREKLEASQALSSRRRQVLVYTKGVVKQVDPVLSSADTLQMLTSQMQDEQASFADNSDSVISYLATMVSYLGTTDPYYYDISYISSMLDTAVSYFDASRADESDLASLSSRYETASKRFENKATRYTLAVEKLQGQLAEAIK